MNARAAYAILAFGALLAVDHLLEPDLFRNRVVAIIVLAAALALIAFMTIWTVIGLVGLPIA